MAFCSTCASRRPCARRLCPGCASMPETDRARRTLSLERLAEKVGPLTGFGAVAEYLQNPGDEATVATPHSAVANA